jgi:hypothetical protein
VFFFGKTLTGAAIQEFPLPASTSLTVKRNSAARGLLSQAAAAPAATQNLVITPGASDAGERAELIGLRNRSISAGEELR